MRRPLAAGLAALLLTLSVAGPATAREPAPEIRARLDKVCSRAKVYGCYANHKYGYVLAWPKGLLTPQGESDAGDGQVFAAPDGRAELRCWAGFNDVLETTIPAALAEAVAEPGRQVTYRHRGKDFFVVSGLEGGKIFYRKTVLAHGVLASFELAYDPAQKALFDPVVRDLAASFSIDPAFGYQ